MHSHFHTLYFEATRQCNFNCAFCSSGSNGVYENENELTTEEIKQRILLPGYRLGTRYIEFSGGEYLLRKDAFELLEYAHSLGYRIGIASNGSTLTKPVLARLQAILGDNLLISLGVNSLDEENMKTRDAEYSFFVKKVAELEEHNIRMNICVTMGRFNAEQFEKTVAHIRDTFKLPFNRIPFVPRNHPDKTNMIDKELLRDYFHPTLRKYFHGYVSYVPFFLSPQFYEEISGQNEAKNQVPTNPSMGCWCGSFYAINPVGDVAPCPLLGDNVSGGNVRETSLSDILFESPLFQRIVKRETFGGKCGKCKFRFTCGGCRSMAYYYNGDVFGEDPTCFIEDLSESELVEMEKEITANFRNYVKMARFGGLFEKPQPGKDS